MIDEADRMMDDIKQDWLTQVENAVYSRDTDRKGTTRAPFGRSLPGPNTVAKYALNSDDITKNNIIYT